MDLDEAILPSLFFQSIGLNEAILHSKTPIHSAYRSRRGDSSINKTILSAYRSRLGNFSTKPILSLSSDLEEEILILNRRIFSAYNGLNLAILLPGLFFQPILIHKSASSAP